MSVVAETLVRPRLATPRTWHAVEVFHCLLGQKTNLKQQQNER